MTYAPANRIVRDARTTPTNGLTFNRNQIWPPIENVTAEKPLSRVVQMAQNIDSSTAGYV
eukprot:5415300-Lingulodinium_polyedra.AAC.1